MKQYLAFDIGGTFIKYALMGEDGSFLENGKTPTPADNLDHMLDAMAEIGAQFEGRFEGVAVSMPGRIDTATGIAHTGGALMYIDATPMGQLLEERLHKPVRLANDAKCAANAEVWSGALADTANGAVLVLGTGTGGAIVLNHQIWMGNTFAAGELSFLPVHFAGLGRIFNRNVHDSGMGSFWASYASASGLLNAYARRKGIPAEELDGLKFFAAYDAGEPEAADALAEFGEMTAAGIYGVQSVLDLGRFAIGGGISARPEVTDIIRTKLDAIYAAVPFTAFGKPEIVRCRYGNDANLIGALRFLLSSI